MIFSSYHKSFFFFLYYQVNLGAIEGVRIVCVARANILEVFTPSHRLSRSKNTILSLSLEVPQHSHIFGAVRVSVGLFIVGGPLFSFFFLFLPKMAAWSYLLLVFQIQILFFWFLFFVLGPFINVLFIFNFII